IEHGAGGTIEWVAPASAAAVVKADAIARRHGDPVGGVGHHQFVVGPVAQRQLVRRALPAAGDAGHGVLHADHVGVHVRRHPYLFDVVAPATPPPLPCSAGIGAVVATPLDVRIEALVDLGCALPQIAEAGADGTPGVHALGCVAPAGVDFGRAVDEDLPGTGVDALDVGRDARLVGLG